MKDIKINPKQSILGLRAYSSFVQHQDERGDFFIWFQPSVELMEEIHNPAMSIQIQQATILPNCTRGHHFHPYEKAIDCFYLETGTMVLGLESINGQVQEFYQIQPNTVCLFPAFVAHTVWNKGKDILRFTTFRTWNFSIDPCVSPYLIEASENIFEKTLQGCLTMNSKGHFGFATEPTTQRNLIL